MGSAVYPGEAVIGVVVLQRHRHHHENRGRRGLVYGCAVGLYAHIDLVCFFLLLRMHYY